MDDRPEQDSESIEKNKSFFSGNDDYAGNVGSLATYRYIREAVNKEISGIQSLLDVGNGGVFDYDTSLVPSIVGVDLFLDDAMPRTLPQNVVLRAGDALALNEPDASYDGVLVVSLLHHLIGESVDGTRDNIRRALSEARRVLVPGGRLILMESCVSARAFAIERHLLGALRRVASTRLMKHPATLQFPPHEIENMVAEVFDSVRVARIPVGPLLLQFGVRWPTILTPARPYLFVAT